MENKFTFPLLNAILNKFPIKKGEENKTYNWDIQGEDYKYLQENPLLPKDCFVKALPLSCHLGTHFTKKVGIKNICMYCNVEVIKADWIKLKYGAYRFDMKKNNSFND